MEVNVIHHNPIERTMWLVDTHPPLATSRLAHGEHAAIAAELTQLTNAQQSLLGIERRAKQEITNRIHALEPELRVLERQIRYRRLPVEPLSWRDERGLPVLVPFSLDSVLFRLSVEGNGSQCRITDVSPRDLPNAISASYREPNEALRQYLWKRRNPLRLRNQSFSYALTCEFSGVIPNEVRKAIADARATFERGIFIIGEPGEWTVDDVTTTEVDPLVVGVDTDGTLWLIAKFDATPIEEAMLSYRSTSASS